MRAIRVKLASHRVPSPSTVSSIDESIARGEQSV